MKHLMNIGFDDLKSKYFSYYNQEEDCYVNIGTFDDASTVTLSE